MGLFKATLVGKDKEEAKVPYYFLKVAYIFFLLAKVIPSSLVRLGMKLHENCHIHVT